MVQIHYHTRSKISKNNPRIPLNYKGISLLSTVYKLYSSILNVKLTQYLETVEYLADEHNGFRQNIACIDHIHSLSTIVKTRIPESKSTFVCSVDIEKSFDWVNRDLLPFKLSKEGVDGKFYHALKSMYSCSVAFVQVNDLQTDWFKTPFGVKQGDVLAPKLVFSLYFKIKNSTLGIHLNNLTVGILLYADDIALLAELEDDLQNMLNILKTWCYRWRLSINQSKTQINHFRKKGTPKSRKILTFGNMKLDYTSDYKCL